MRILTLRIHLVAKINFGTGAALGVICRYAQDSKKIETSDSIHSQLKYKSNALPSCFNSQAVKESPSHGPFSAMSFTSFVLFPGDFAA